jgi:hypothetical protein
MDFQSYLNEQLLIYKEIQEVVKTASMNTLTVARVAFFDEIESSHYKVEVVNSNTYDALDYVQSFKRNAKALECLWAAFDQPIESLAHENFSVTVPAQVVSSNPVHRFIIRVRRQFAMPEAEL